MSMASLEIRGLVGSDDLRVLGRHDEPELLLLEFPPWHRQTVGPIVAGLEQLFGIGRERPEIGAGRGGHAQHGAVEEAGCHWCHIINPKKNGRVVEPQIPPHVSGMEAAARGIDWRPLAQRAQRRAGFGRDQAVPRE